MAKRRGTVYSGTSGWAYPTWRPYFYPQTVPPRRFLEHYGSRLNSVEVNYTFRALPAPDQLAGWLAAVPAHFRFSFKAPESITHRKRLRSCDKPLAEFLNSLDPVRRARKLGLLLFQLPPNFQPDLERLAAFLAAPAWSEPAYRRDRIAFEFRHAGWFQKDVYTLLRRHGAAVCIAKTDSLETPEVQTARSFSSYRLRRPGGYDAAETADHAEQFHALAASGRDVYVYYMHEDEPTGPLAAERMLRSAAATAASASAAAD